MCGDTDAYYTKIINRRGDAPTQPEISRANKIIPQHVIRSIPLLTNTALGVMIQPSGPVIPLLVKRYRNWVFFAEWPMWATQDTLGVAQR